jgi:two-component system sensor histidine kinase CreC
MLELSAIESRTRLEAPEEVDFAALVAQAIDQVRPLAEVAGVGIRWEEGEEGQAGRLSAVTGETPVLHAVTGEKPVLHGDAFILRAAVTNLLENAVDFSPKGGVIEMNLRVVNGCAELTIRDYGPGIPDYARERVFERFYSLRHHSVGRKGTGLGLTLVREAADLHRGTIALEPAVGVGTVARFTLPLG